MFNYNKEDVQFIKMNSSQEIDLSEFCRSVPGTGLTWLYRSDGSYIFNHDLEDKFDFKFIFPYTCWIYNEEGAICDFKYKPYSPHRVELNSKNNKKKLVIFDTYEDAYSYSMTTAKICDLKQISIDEEIIKIN